MDNITAENIGKMARSLKHLNKLLHQVDKDGGATIKLNCTGVTLTVTRGDAINLELRAVQARTAQQLHSICVVNDVPVPVTTTPEPEAKPQGKGGWTPERRAERAAYMREYWRKVKEGGTPAN